MLLAILLLANAADWVPMRWHSSDPKSLGLLKNTPINCLLLEREHWKPAFLRAAHENHIATLGVVRASAKDLDSAREAQAQKLDGVVIDGDYAGPSLARLESALEDSKISYIRLASRSGMDLASKDAVIGSYQGVWPGIEASDAGTKAAPSGAPWINTNSGFLRFVRAASSDAALWIANSPPPKTVYKVERYMQAISDAETSGARWVISLGRDLEGRLLVGDPDALADWKRLMEHLAFYESHPDWRKAAPKGRLALIEDASTGALLSGGILDMIAVKNTPARAVPVPRLSDAAMKEAKLAVDVDPADLTPEQRSVLARFTRGGGTILSGPPGWKFPAPKPGQITLDDAEVKTLDEIWKEMNSMVNHRNLGARLFNVSSMISNLVAAPDGKTILHLVNYSSYPIESVTVHMLGKYRAAKLYAPGTSPVDLPLYDSEEGSGIDIERVAASAAVVLE